MKNCSIEGCSKPVRARGWCNKHWARWNRRGSPFVVFTNYDKAPKYDSLKDYLFDSFDIKNSDECWIWKRSFKKFGYGNAWWKGKHHSAHRLVYEYYNGEIPFSMNVCHKCDNPKCVNPNHLFLGSYLENNRDRKTKGRNSNTNGEKNPFSKLNDNQVIDIKKRLKDGESVRLLADKFKVNYHTIHKIKIGINWKHIGDSQ